jgi:hypothetical protein
MAVRLAISFPQEVDILKYIFRLIKNIFVLPH